MNISYVQFDILERKISLCAIISYHILMHNTLAQFKKGDIFFNYGCLPRTWEDPTFIHPDAEGCRGDNDPVDVCEIGARIVKTGEIRPTKVLGILCMIDEGEADWKVVTIDAEDKWAPFLNDIVSDVKLLAS